MNYKMVNSPTSPRNKNSRVAKIIKKTRLLYISLGLSAATATYIIGLTVQRVQRNAAARNRYTRNIENYSKYCGWTGKTRNAPKNFHCVKPIRPSSMAVPKGFFGHVSDVALATKYLVITMMVCAMIGTLSIAYLKVQQSRLVGIARGRATAEAGLAKRSGETTVRTAEKLEDVTAECINGAKDLIKALNKLDRDLAAAALNNSPNKNSKILKIKASKAYVEEALAPALARTAAAGRAQQFFLDTLTSEERRIYNDQLNNFIAGSGAMAIAMANQQQAASVTAKAGLALTAAANTGKKIAMAYGTGGAALMLGAPTRRMSPVAALPAPGNASPNTPPRRRSLTKTPNTRNVNMTLNKLLKQFN